MQIFIESKNVVKELQSQSVVFTPIKSAIRLVFSLLLTNNLLYYQLKTVNERLKVSRVTSRTGKSSFISFQKNLQNKSQKDTRRRESTAETGLVVMLTACLLLMLSPTASAAHTGWQPQALLLVRTSPYFISYKY